MTSLTMMSFRFVATAHRELLPAEPRPIASQRIHRTNDTMVLGGYTKVLNESAIGADTKVPANTNVHSGLPGHSVVISRAASRHRGTAS